VARIGLRMMPPFPCPLTSVQRVFPSTAPCAPLAGTSREWFHAFVGDSLSTCRPLRPREALRLLAPSSFADDVGLRPVGMVSALPTAPTLRFSRGVLFRGLTTVRSRYDLSICSPPCRSWPGFHGANGDFSRAARDHSSRTLPWYHGPTGCIYQLSYRLF
jgi:hypothetical protein